MRTVLLALLTVAASFGAEANLPELRTVDTVDLDRYMGRWFEIARLPNRFQNDCTGDVTAHYSLIEDGKLRVVNECRKAGDKLMSAEGAARRAGPAKLEVRFAPAWLGFLPAVWGDYWVIDLADDYSWAVVGERGRKYFWVLARLPRMDEEVLRGIIERAEEQGYELSTMVRTEHEDRVSEAR